MIENIIRLIEGFITLSPEQHIFFISIFALSITGFALYVVLVIFKSYTDSMGRQ